MGQRSHLMQSSYNEALVLINPPDLWTDTQLKTQIRTKNSPFDRNTKSTDTLRGRDLGSDEGRFIADQRR